MEQPILLEVHYKMKKGTKEIFYQAIIDQKIDEAARAEAGNLKYEFYYPAYDEDAILLMEIWKSPDAHAFHKTTQHFADMGILKDEYVLEMNVIRHDLASV